MEAERTQREGVVRAAGYVRVSRALQAEGHSPDVQRAAISALAAREGYQLVAMEEDAERGHRVTRRGYQAILALVRAGAAQAVLVYYGHRWGRDGVEWLTRARELDRLGVPIISVQEGRDEPGLLRYVKAGLYEEYSRQLAKQVRPAMERSARAGVHQGPTPYGYRRVYSPRVAGGTRARPDPGHLEPDDAEAPVLRELFERYAAGGISLRALAADLNARGVPGPAGGAWSQQRVWYLLHSPVYAGRVRHNYHPSGHYERADADDVFEAEGRHEALVDAATYAAVQARLALARRVPSASRQPVSVPLAAGLLHCPDCGGVLTPHRTRQQGRGMYYCSNRRHGRSACASPGVSFAVAHQALLAEIARLRGRPWAPVRPPREGVDQRERASAERALGRARERLRAHVRAAGLVGDDAHALAAYRAVQAELSQAVRAAEARVAALGGGPASESTGTPERATHALVAEELPTLIKEAQDADALALLRPVVVQLVERAIVVERQPAHRATWVRLAVTWSDVIARLLARGALVLDAAAPRPAPPSRAEQKRRAEWARRQRRRQERQRAKRAQAHDG